MSVPRDTSTINTAAKHTTQQIPLELIVRAMISVDHDLDQSPRPTEHLQGYRARVHLINQRTALVACFPILLPVWASASAWEGDHDADYVGSAVVGLIRARVKSGRDTTA